MKDRLNNFILIIFFLVGLSLLLYPSFSDYWNSFTQSKAIAAYSEKLASLNDEMYDIMLEDARAYNKRIHERENVFMMDDVETEEYNSLLDVTGNGVMGYIEIPIIGVSLPIYHGTTESVLQVAIGHLEWTSLPVGGKNTHSVVSGHRGLPSAKLFTDLDKLTPGDIFTMRILDELLTYEVDQILIVEPHEVDALLIEEGKDYCTLVTCTPYRINSHRMLVRGHRIENTEQSSTIRVTSDGIQLEPLVLAPFVGVPLLLVAMILLMMSDSYAAWKLRSREIAKQEFRIRNSQKERR